MAVEGFQKSYDGGCGIRPFCPKTATSTRKRVQPAITDCCRSAAHEAPLHKHLPHPFALRSGHPWPPRFQERRPHLPRQTLELDSLENERGSEFVAQPSRKLKRIGTTASIFKQPPTLKHQEGVTQHLEIHPRQPADAETAVR